MNPSTLVENLTGLEPHLLSKIKGQGHVISRVCSVLERGQFGLQPTGKPLGSFLFLGPTGVGKTELTLVTYSVRAPCSGSICRNSSTWTT
jgi:ATP-dependent Clp protease ATP-binding subunit ClpA